MLKLQQMLALAPSLALAYDGTRPQRIGEFFDALNHPDVLATIVDTYDMPVGAMTENAAIWFFKDGPKPEWLMHAGL